MREEYGLMNTDFDFEVSKINDFSLLSKLYLKIAILS